MSGRDRRGLIHEKDVVRLAEFRAVIDETFKTNLAAGATVSASNVRDNSSNYAAANVLDGNRRTHWATDNGVVQASLTVDLGRSKTFDRALIQEEIRLGQRVKAFAIEAWDGRGWRRIAAGTTIGHKRLLRFPAVTTSRVRLLIREARASPAISEFGLFKASLNEGTLE